MILENLYLLAKAIDAAIPCYTPRPQGPYGDEGRCGECEGCVDSYRVEEVLYGVEKQVEELATENDLLRELVKGMSGGIEEIVDRLVPIGTPDRDLLEQFVLELGNDHAD